jgi:hypothetical protein
MRTLRFACTALTLLLLAHAPSISEAKGRPSGGGGGRGSVQLTPEAVVPGPGDTGGSAFATVSVGRGEVNFSVSVTTLSGFITTIAIYKGDPGQVGPMVVRLSPSPIGINQLMGHIPVDSELARDLGRTPSSYFIQINTNAYPGGAVRAQLK